MAYNKVPQMWACLDGQRGQGLTPEERVDLIQQMIETAELFCKTEDIPMVNLSFEKLDFTTNGEYNHKLLLIRLDLDKNNDHVRTLFHELFHHWQWCKIPKWYERAYGFWTRHVFHVTTIEKYFNSRLEVEARSFARSTIEELDAM
ncbi:MAG TPA: hypothetical protein VFV92_15875 [Candidatus Bathyarchaeia archaeon]|nr:hypothetical protein [Candidatus Bathyarchaeia archaeon]